MLNNGLYVDIFCLIFKISISINIWSVYWNYVFFSDMYTSGDQMQYRLKIRLGTTVSFSKWLHRIHQMTIKIRPSFCLLSSPGNYFAVSLLPNRRKIFIDIWYKAVYWFNSPRYCATLYNKRWSTFNLLLRMFILLLTSDRVIQKHLFSR